MNCLPLKMKIQVLFSVYALFSVIIFTFNFHHLQMRVKIRIRIIQKQGVKTSKNKIVKVKHRPMEQFG